LKLRRRGGRPSAPLEIRRLIRDLANPLWGAPRIHGELLKLGTDVGQTSVAKYIARGRRGPEGFSLQSRRRHRFDGSVRRADTSFWLLYGLSGSAAPSTSNHVVGGDGKSDG
jgi:hypothetical protein